MKHCSKWSGLKEEVRNIEQDAEWTICSFLRWGGGNVCLCRYDHLKLPVNILFGEYTEQFNITASYMNSPINRAKKSASQWEEFMVMQGNHFDN